MPQSLSLLIVHIIFSTKDRKPLPKKLLSELHPYLATVTRNSDCECYRAGGVEDHVHLAIRLSRSASVAKLVGELKTSSSKWLKSKDIPDFAWQRGYAAFSVGPGDVEALLKYIDKQEEHHRKSSFQDELRLLLAKYGVIHDERYMWD